MQFCEIAASCLLTYICSFLHAALCFSHGLNSAKKLTQKRNEGGNTPGAKSLWGRWITAGGAEKSQQCRNYFPQQHICFRKISGSNMGAPNLFLAL